VTEQELRALVRDAIARHAVSPMGSAHGGAPSALLPAVSRQHPSHALFVALGDGADAGGPCVIEPAVACNHCGYCKSFGH
jgi:hypothetical protein